MKLAGAAALFALAASLGAASAAADVRHNCAKGIDCATGLPGGRRPI